MKKTTLLFCMIAWALTAFSQDYLKLMSYNVRNARGMDGVLDYQRIANVILNENPDVVAVQELDSMTTRSKQKYVLNEIANRTQLKANYAPAISYQGGKYGIGILSKEQPLNIRTFPLPGREEARMLMVAEFKDFFFACTHLSLTEEDRLSSLNIIKQSIGQSKKPFFLAGDLNDTPDSKFIQNLQEDFEILNDIKVPTHPSPAPKKTIDYIAAWKGNTHGLAIVSTQVLEEPIASDHRPISVTIRISPTKAQVISDETRQQAATSLIEKYSNCNSTLMQRGINQVASLWQDTDGNEEAFVQFVKQNYMADKASRRQLFDKLCTAYEVLMGTSNQVAIELGLPTVLAGPEPTRIDYIFSAFNPYSHLWNDLYENKVAFITILNFPNFTLEEKNELGKTWSREEWAYARMGDMFTSRVPASLRKEAGQANADAENYIANYNIMMGHLLNDKGQKLFPEDMVLLTHWNLRDEIKSNYANPTNGLEKQEMICRVLEHIVQGTIPQAVINNPAYEWAPASNRTWENGKEVTLEAENNRRYEHILAHFKAMKKVDAYEPQQPSGIIRNFEGGMEILPREIENLFVNLVSSPQVKQVSKLIQKKLKRKLRPYDIWYDGFKSRSTISEDELTTKTRSNYPTPEAFEADMPRMLEALGFSKEDATFLASKISVEGARGSGHAWGASGRWQNSLLRTRIGKEGMDYKGYNIAVHEFGHNVEQTIDLYHIDHYTMNGVPNTGFTEALAFVFQKRDLQLLGYDQQVDDNTTLDIFWGLYEIMGVSLVDMYMWQWLYAHPDATASELKDATVAIAKDVWNKYYYPVLGEKDSSILACYSHMVNAAMYLPNYPLGHIIEFQLEEHFAKCESKKAFADEIMRIYKLGRLTPNQWMQEAVGANVSTTPILNAVDAILKKK